MEMTINKQQVDERTAQAADFAAMLYSGVMTAEEEQALASWLEQSAESRAEYESMLDVWHSTGALSSRLDELGEEVSEKRPPVKPRQRWLPVALAASVLFGVAVAWQGWFVGESSVPESQLAIYQTSTGENRAVTLGDGSLVILNTNTRLLVDYSENQRRVTLNWGEAYFEVTADPNRPFLVDTEGKAVTVLGTRFNVQKAGFALKVAVVEGLVAVHRAENKMTPTTEAVDIKPGQPIPVEGTAGKYRLGAGVMATFTGNMGSSSARITSEEISQSDNFPDWRFGRIRFMNRTLQEVVKELNRYTTKKILIEDSRVMDVKVSGVFKLNAIDAALKRFEQALPLRVVEYPDRIVITGLD
ncbi:FecR domain-containing protein [Porticoccaceae bacterium LTM1]|nr:FecR domain-containing protein [Porticoccaceae bacterium LTM1]